MIHRRYSEPITLNDIAAEVFVSPFHLSRVFSQEIGVPPGRYLSAVRMFEAKRLLVASRMTVCDIVHSVGYNSVGTFTSRFSRATGMTPRQYRRPEVERALVAASGGFSRMPSLQELNRPTAPSGGPRTATGPTGTLSGVVDLPRHRPGTNLVIGLYREPIPQRAPVAHLALPATSSTRFTFPSVPAGPWTVMALAMPPGTSADGADVLVGAPVGRVTVHPRTDTRTRFTMRRLTSTDAPIAVTLRTPPPPVGRGPEPALRAHRPAADPSLTGSRT
ncbi:helix-turn-helix domain-containing protein [Nocardiopsis sp. NPDC006938]|uniref:helix-turn-helix transcriptional regulator n=1 Tax=Nocardiopsis sp. NPDC006938 TaxID=3364337 RepID=UPI0036D165A3